MSCDGGGGHRRRRHIHGCGPRRKGDRRVFRPNSARPQVEVDASGRSGSRSSPLAGQLRGELQCGSARPRAGRGSSPCRRRPPSRRRRAIASASAPVSTPPMPITGIETAAATRRTCSSATVRTAGPESPPLPAPSQGSAAPGASGVAFIVLISETASAPPSSAATATAAGSATFGVSFTISGFAVSGRSGLEQRPRLGRLLADDQPGLDVRAGDVELDRRDLVARRRPRSTSARELLGARRHHRDDQRHRQLGELRQVVREEALEALVREPDRVDHPGRRLPERGGGLPARGSGVIVFETKALKGKRSSSASPKARRAAIASKVPRAVDDRVGEAQPAEVDGRRAGPMALIGGPLPRPAPSRSPRPRTTGPSTQRRM